MNHFIIYSTILFGILTAQEYNWPTDAGKSLRSNFGEFRDGHFHMGIDIKTNGKEGASVFAVEDGYISRMVANFKGYGRALYIIHPDGRTSVYIFPNSIQNLKDFLNIIKIIMHHIY
mgnify:CR=1 FL=1